MFSKIEEIFFIISKDLISLFIDISRLTTILKQLKEGKIDALFENSSLIRDMTQEYVIKD
jgi:ABC-type amino acid transport substrate-binding protein